MNTYLKKMLEHSSWPEAVPRAAKTRSGGEGLGDLASIKGV
jgi:hypothetical protein